MRNTALALAVIWLGVVGISLAQDEPAKVSPEAATEITAPAEAIEDLTARVAKSIVTITSAGRDGVKSNIGTGFIISADGLIATNFHVVGEGRPVRVQTADGRGFDAATVHASHRQYDLALLRIDAENLPALELGTVADVKQGQRVVALGNPAGLRFSVVSGVVSAVREIEGRQMIQVAIPIEPGNSGGPLVDLDGRVLGILTMKSVVTPNLGFAVSIDLLKPLVEKPNPIPMTRWLTIGALDPREWQPIFGARWRQRAGRITVEGAGDGFGGRSLCLWNMDVPETPVEVSVNVQLDDESGAAGLAFCSDGGYRHFGFYPTAGRLRLTRFDGPDVLSWTILHDRANEHYRTGKWNTLRVRLEEGKVTCFVNDRQCVEMVDKALVGGKFGLVKFRNTNAEFKNFSLGKELPTNSVGAEDIERIVKLVTESADRDVPKGEVVATLAKEPDRAARVLRDRADELDREAGRLRNLAKAAHEHHVVEELAAALAGEEKEVDLFRAGLLVARLDNEDVEVDAYVRELERMADELKASLETDATDQQKLDALKKYLFDENGFHGSRGDYYHRANSYLNEVLDDREGLPITLSIVYIELARRIGLSIEGVGLPGHFVVRHVPAEGEPQLIDVFEGAALVSREEANRRVKEATDRELTESDLAASTKREIVLRMLQNLLSVSTSDTAALGRYLNAALALDGSNGHYHWLRAIVRLRLEDRAGAAEDVEWLVEHKPEGVDPSRVLEMQRVLRQAEE